MDPELLQYFDIVCDKIDAHPSYGAKLEDAVRAGRNCPELHTRTRSGLLRVVCVRRSGGAARARAPLEEPAHLQDQETRQECAPRMGAFTGGSSRPTVARAVVFLDGVPFQEP
jgi:hypothetical protein